MYDRYSELSKYKITRHVLGDLDRMGDEGLVIQRRIATELARMRRLPDDSVPDRDAAINTLREFKDFMVKCDMITREDRMHSQQRLDERQARMEAIWERENTVRALHLRFTEMARSKEDPQSRGYGLEDLLVDLFAASDVEYRPPYRAGVEQIDGQFRFGGFDYLVEAKWRKDSPSQADLAAFKLKVDKKLFSTRGLFVSIAPFRPEVVQEFTVGHWSNIILMSGEDLALILEGQVSLTMALDAKIQKAAQEGIIYFPLRELS